MTDTLHAMSGIEIHPAKARRLALGQITGKTCPKGITILKLPHALDPKTEQQVILPRLKDYIDLSPLS